MNFLVVHCHPEPRSFVAALKNTAVETLQAMGHRVTVSDLYALGFDPVARPTDFAEVADTTHFRYNREGGAALARGTPQERFSGFEPRLAAEMTKLDQADVLIFTAPVWWFSLPALLKGWVDKVLALNFAYGHTALYETGLLKGKRALLALAAGGVADWYAPDGINGPVNENFYHVHHGVFWYCGMTVLEPYVAHAPGRADDAQRAALLRVWKDRLTNLDSSTVLYPRLS